MLDTARANAIAASINADFALIGYGDARMPRSKKATEPAAWEYHVAGHLVRAADARKAAAVKAAIKLGVIFDPAKDAREPGTETLVYAGDVVEIALSVTTPAERLDAVALGVALVNSGMSVKIVEKLFRACTNTSRAPHKFTSNLVTK